MKEVKEYLDKAILDNSKVVVACSGGPDSMCLLHLVLEQKEKKNLTVICAHVNHKVRIESEAEAKFVKDYCNQHDAIFEYMEITDYNDDNFHNQARMKRYEFFKEVIAKHNATYLLTAHHGDDLTETILMRIMRGSNLKGYLGFKREMSYNTYKLLRPLITITKQDIEKFNKENKISFVTDLSNEKDKYTRNRYRHIVLPFLKNEAPDAHLKFLKFSQELSQFDEFLVNYMSNLLTTLIKDDTLNISLFHKEDDFIKRQVIEKMIEKIQEDDLFVIEDKHVDLILDLINNNKPNSYIELPNGYIAEKSYNNFKIVKSNNIVEYNKKLEGTIYLPNGFKLKMVNEADRNSNNIIRLNTSDLELPLYVRTRKDGDKIAVKNLNGSKKVKDIFIDNKIATKERNSWPIVVDSNNTVIWLPGLKKSKFDKEITDNYDIIIKYEEDNND